jgi:gas vesicle protein
MENSKNSNVKLIGALLLGAVVGTAIGILFAPAKGSKTRNKIADDAKDMAESLKNKLNGEINSLQQRAADLKSDAKGKMEEIAGSVKESIESLKNKN